MRRIRMEKKSNGNWFDATYPMVVEWSTVLWWIHVKWFPYSWNKNSHCWCWSEKHIYSLLCLVNQNPHQQGECGKLKRRHNAKKNVLLHGSNMHKNIKCRFNMIHIRRILTSMEFRPIFLHFASLLFSREREIILHFIIESFRYGVNMMCSFP